MPFCHLVSPFRKALNYDNEPHSPMTIVPLKADNTLLVCAFLLCYWLIIMSTSWNGIKKVTFQLCDHGNTFPIQTVSKRESGLTSHFLCKKSLSLEMHSATYPRFLCSLATSQSPVPGLGVVGWCQIHTNAISPPTFPPALCLQYVAFATSSSLVAGSFKLLHYPHKMWNM